MMITTTDYAQELKDLGQDNNLAESDTWHRATPEQQRKLVNAVVTFSNLIDVNAQEYRAKQTLEGEFVACVLYDWFFDLVEPGLTTLDYELDTTYQPVDNVTSAIDYFSNRLLDDSSDMANKIKILKRTYKEDEERIKELATDDETGQIDLGLVNDFSAEYRDSLY